MSVVLPLFSRPLDRQVRNRYLQAYRRWACEQQQAGKPVTCWCLYIWIAGNWKSRMNIAERPMVRPNWSTKSQWAGWNDHKRNGGRLSFQEYLAKREKRSIAGQGRRTDMETRSVRKPKDEGLRMEPASVIAKINRILAAQGIKTKQVAA